MAAQCLCIIIQQYLVQARQHSIKPPLVQANQLISSLHRTTHSFDYITTSLTTASRIKIELR